ncbi:MAG: hypothetical protein ACKVZH_00375 [Blastocatellia bacterium]
MTTTTDNQKALTRRYLLGDLPEQEQLALESKFFADANLLEQMQNIETNLVDEYVRGQLSNADQRQFERHYLTTPAHKERVAFAGELLRAANEQTHPQAAQPQESFWEKALASLRAPQFAFGVAVTAAVLLVAGTVWLKNQQANWQQQIAKTETERVAEQERLRQLETLVAQQNQLNAELTNELERLRAESSKPTSQPSVFSFVLLSGVRGGEQQTLKLPPDTNQIRLQMKLEADDFPRYRASLRPVDGGPSWTASSVTKTGSTISVKIPASKLRNGDYILTLAGVDATGAIEEINRYSFRVASK